MNIPNLLKAIPLIRPKLIIQRKLTLILNPPHHLPLLNPHPLLQIQNPLMLPTNLILNPPQQPIHNPKPLLFLSILAHFHLPLHQLLMNSKQKIAQPQTTFPKLRILIPSFLQRIFPFLSKFLQFQYTTLIIVHNFRKIIPKKLFYKQFRAIIKQIRLIFAKNNHTKLLQSPINSLPILALLQFLMRLHQLLLNIRNSNLLKLILPHLPVQFLFKFLPKLFF